MENQLNEFGQPIGFPVVGWTPPPSPPRTPLDGRYCRLEPLQSAFNRDGTILAAGTFRIEGTNEAYKALLLRAPSLAEIATLEAGNPATGH
jgi:hypothetical protein